MDRVPLLAALLSIALFGCAASNSSPAKTTAAPPSPSVEPHPVTSATPQQQAALLDRVKALQGDWEMKGPDGKTVTAAVFTVTSNGSAVREVMFPGSGEEMTNMYHMDGPSMVMVHYCGEGNQPRMRATTADATTNQIAFKFDGVSNMTSADQDYMGTVTITFTDPDHIRTTWQSFKKQKANEQVIFELTRKKA